MFYTRRVLALPPTLSDRLSRGGCDLTLLILRLGAMGDILRTLPPLRLIRSALPRARILWGAEDRHSKVLNGHPDIDELLVAPRKDWDRWIRSLISWPRLAGSIAAFRRAMRAQRPDLVLDFHGNLRSGLLGWFSGAPVRVGYAGHQQKEGNRLFTTHHVASGDRRASRMRRNLDLVAGLGIAADSIPRSEFPLADAGRERARAILDGKPGVAIVAAGVSVQQAFKKPPPELLGAACRVLRSRGLDPLVVHGPGELDDARAVVACAADAATLAPPTDLPTLAALLRSARIFVGGDTGPLHMACIVGCPVLGIYGPTDPSVNEPWSPTWRAVFPPGRAYTGIKRLDRRAGLFEGLRPEAVEQAVLELLDAPRDGSRLSS